MTSVTELQLNDPTINPSQLNLRHLQYYGSGSHVSIADAWSNWNGSRNPFIPGSPNDVAFRAYCITMQERDKARYLKLPEVPYEIRPSKRRLSMPRLKLQFETLSDARLRLVGSCIFVGAQLWYVQDIRELDGDYLLLLNDAAGKTFRCWYSNPAVDLRSPEPQYIVYEERPAFMVRVQNRQQRQGISSETAYGRWVGSEAPGHEFRIHGFSWLMRSAGSEPVMWSASLSDLILRAGAMNALRLSKTVAVYLKQDEHQLYAEYKGRPLGRLHDNEILADSLDASKPWIDRDTKNVGCKLRAA